MDRALEIAKGEFNARRGVELPVSAPFHSAYMSDAGEEVALSLSQCQTMSPMIIPMISNVNAKEVSEVSEVTEMLIRQTVETVRWRDSVEYALSQGVDTFVELGPGVVLSSLIRKQAPNARVFNVDNTKDVITLRDALKEE